MWISEKKKTSMGGDRRPGRGAYGRQIPNQRVKGQYGGKHRLQTALQQKLRVILNFILEAWPS
jgi:hypothetical protein